MGVLMSKTSCNKKDEQKRYAFEQNVQSRLIYTIAFPPEKSILIVGKKGMHSFILLEQKNKNDATTKVTRIELFKTVHQDNSSLAIYFGAPAFLIGTRDVTGNKYENVELLSNHIVLTAKQTEDLLRMVKEKSRVDIYYTSAGNHPTYSHSSIFSGAEYQNCNGFVEQMLKDIGVIEDTTKWNFQVMKLPSHVLENLDVPNQVDLLRPGYSVYYRKKSFCDFKHFNLALRENEALREQLREVQKTQK